LVAYIVSKDERRLTVEELRGYLSERLPFYMVPNLFVFTESLPLTASGKIDRKNLPEPETTRPRLGQAYVGASSSAEKRLVGLWQQVLGFELIGIDDNFFDLGGNSLLAARLAEQIRQAFRVDMPVLKIFEFPRIRLLARYLGQGESAQPSLDDAARRAEDRRASRNLSRRARGDRKL
jgi:hypothetical protein